MRRGGDGNSWRRDGGFPGPKLIRGRPTTPDSIVGSSRASFIARRSGGAAREAMKMNFSAT